MGSAVTELPPLPPGFTLDAAPPAGGGDLPPLPAGFTLDKQNSVSSKPNSATDASLYDKGDEFGKKALRALREGVRIIGQGMASMAGAPLAPELQPQNTSERIGTGIDRMLGSVGTGIAAGRTMAQSAGPIVSRIGQVLQSNPGMQTVGAVSGPVAREVAAQAGAGPVGQNAAELAGAMAPGAIAAGTVAATRGAFRGGEAGRQTVANNIDTFEQAGMGTPSVGQATESRAMRAAEAGLAVAPGGAGPMAKKAEAEASELAASIEQRASQLAGKSSAEQAGRAITSGIKGEGGFVERFKSQQKDLYDKLDAFVPKQQPVNVAKTKAALAALNADIPNAPELSKFFKNAKIQGIEGALESDALGPKPASGSFAIAQAEGQIRSSTQAELPYEAVKKLRTLVGNEMADAGLTSDVPRSKWSALYAALSEDLGATVATNPQAKAAWARANTFTRVGMKRLEVVDSVIGRNGGPEAVFKAATGGTKEGATTLRAVMQSLDEGGQKVVSATVLRRLGIAKSGVQSDLGDRFSTETFLTNWNSLSKEAKSTLFDRYGSGFRSDMDAVAKATSNLREGSQVFRNPSGTAQKTVLITTLSSLGAAMASGHPGTAATIASGVGLANLSARLMTNPRFVHWLASTTNAPTGAYVAAVDSLANTAKKTGDLDLARAVATLEQNEQYKPKKDRRRQQDQPSP